MSTLRFPKYVLSGFISQIHMSFGPECFGHWGFFHGLNELYTCFFVRRQIIWEAVNVPLSLSFISIRKSTRNFKHCFFSYLEPLLLRRIYILLPFISFLIQRVSQKLYNNPNFWFDYQSVMISFSLAFFAQFLIPGTLRFFSYGFSGWLRASSVNP